MKSATEMVGAGQTWKQAFVYDRFGNKNFDTANTTIQSTDTAVAKITNPEILPTNNQFKQDQDGDSQPDYLFDPSGNLTKNARDQNFTYDAENRQITTAGPGLSTSHSYDGNGKRVKSHNSVTNQTTIFVYGAEGDLSAEYTVNVPPPATPTISFLTEDALGSVRVTTNSFGEIKARRDFLPFGEDFTPRSLAETLTRNILQTPTTRERSLRPISEMPKRTSTGHSHATTLRRTGASQVPMSSKADRMSCSISRKTRAIIQRFMQI